MLTGWHRTPSLADLLIVFRSCFTAPTSRSFAGLVVGLIAQTRRRTICGMLLGAGLERLWHHARARRFFAAARCIADTVGLVLADLIVTRVLPVGAPIAVAAWRHAVHTVGEEGVRCGLAPATVPRRTPSRSGSDTCWVVAGIVVALPFLSRPVCLPVPAR